MGGLWRLAGKNIKPGARSGYLCLFWSVCTVFARLGMSFLIRSPGRSAGMTAPGKPGDDEGIR